MKTNLKPQRERHTIDDLIVKNRPDNSEILAVVLEEIELVCQDPDVMMPPPPWVPENENPLKHLTEALIAVVELPELEKN